MAVSAVVLVVAVPVAAFNVWAYDRLFGMPGLPIIPETWWQLVLMLVIPAGLAAYWLAERVIVYREDRRYRGV